MIKTARSTDLAIALPENKRRTSSVEDVYSEVKNPTIRIHKRWVWLFVAVWLAMKCTLILCLFYKKENNKLSQQLQQQQTNTAISAK
ncbi:hypothetical protein HNQ91_002023 [Filimonas zeae]|nr:hypothetical protein [Filimonas zeae]MDR6338972.1 hypothetical protein [Filimonas zeae]